MKLTLKDVAERAGVSEATVSRVVNGKTAVAASTREAVTRVLEELGYVPPGLPRRRAGGTVGLILPELVNPVFPAFAQAMGVRLAGEGFTTILCTSTPDGGDEDGYVDMLLDRGVAGFVFVCGEHSDTTADTSRYRRLLSRGLPTVFVNGYVEGLAATFISADEVTAGQLAARHLLDLGHRRIGFAPGELRYTAARRKLAGFSRELEQSLGAVDSSLIAESTFTVEGGQVAMAELLDRGVTAVVAGGDLMALGAIRACRERGLSVPGDVSVVGYDDTVLMAFTDPPLTSVRQPVAAMASAAAHALVQIIGGARTPAQGEYLFRPELVVRGSSGPRRRSRAEGGVGSASTAALQSG